MTKKKRGIANITHAIRIVKMKRERERERENEIESERARDREETPNDRISKKKFEKKEIIMHFDIDRFDHPRSVSSAMPFDSSRWRTEFGSSSSSIALVAFVVAVVSVSVFALASTTAAALRICDACRSSITPWRASIVVGRHHHHHHRHYQT